MAMDWLNKLNDEQAIYAAKIADKAKELGVPERLALSIAYHESGFNPHKIGGAKEIGLMQVLPSTAKGMGYTIAQMHDPDTNIEAGLKYLKQHLDTYSAPELATLAYNRGPGVADQFISGKDDAAGKNYVSSVKALGGFTQPVEVAETPPVALPSEEPTAEQLMEQVSQVKQPAADIAQQKLYGQVGAGLGALGQGAALGKQAVGKTAQYLGKQAALGQIAAQQAAQQAGAQPAAGVRPQPSTGGQAPIYTEPQVGRLLEGTTDEAGLTGRARQESYNTRTSQEATARRVAAPLYENLVRQGVIASPDEYFARQPTQVATRGGVLISAEAAQRMRDEAAAAQQAAAAAQAAKPVPPLQQITQTFQRMMASPVAQGVSKIASRVLTPLGLYGAGSEGMAAYQEMQRAKPDYPMAVASGLSALGGGLSAIPATAAVGIPLGIAASMAKGTLEQMKRQAIPPAQLEKMMGPQTMDMSGMIAPQSATMTSPF